MKPRFIPQGHKSRLSRQAAQLSFILSIGLIVLLWQLLVIVTAPPSYILPGPWPVVIAMVDNFPQLLHHLAITATEIVVGLFFGTLFGAACAVAMIASTLVRCWLQPLIVISQALPVFALAPLLVLWFGYGMGSKVVMALLIIFFPVASSFYQGMRRTPQELLDLAQIMGADRSAVLRRLVIPYGLPALAAGVRMAAAVAPIGAVVGEWVGSSGGLGYYMLHANGRMQIAEMFAALALLASFSLMMWFAVDRLMARLVYWEPEQKD
jgi:putative hydroxymethylpyrimidine transport system permease protein